MASPPKASAHPIRSRLKQLPVYAQFKQLGHYPDYWWWKLRGEPRRIPHVVKQRVVLEYAEKFGLTTLIETGTYYGEMIAAVHGRFDRIYSIEIDARLAAIAQQRFDDDESVQIIHGDSQSVVPELVRRLDQACLWWLDAGYCGWTGEIGNPNRLSVEMEAILADTGHSHVILMDDADGVVGLEEFTASIRSNYPDRNLEVARNIIRITPAYKRES